MDDTRVSFELSKREVFAVVFAGILRGRFPVSDTDYVMDQAVKDADALLEVLGNADSSDSSNQS